MWQFSVYYIYVEISVIFAWFRELSRRVLAKNPLLLGMHILQILSVKWLNVYIENPDEFVEIRDEILWRLL